MRLESTSAPYSELSPQEVLSRLTAAGVNVTLQTLRNWEADRLITPPIRGSGYGGRWTKYFEYVLAECYAAHMLLHVLPKKMMDKSTPKYSPEMLAHARATCRFHPSGWPERPISETIRLHHLADGVMAKDYRWDDPPQIDLTQEYSNLAETKKSDSFETLLEYTTKLSAELMWFKYLTEGAKAFGLPPK